MLGEFSTKELSIWVVVDLDTVQGRQVARNAINYTVSLSLPPPPLSPPPPLFPPTYIILISIHSS